MDQIKIIIETIAVIITALIFFRITRRSMQILQQEQYLSKGYLLYLRKYYFKDINNLCLFAHLLFIPFLNYFYIQIFYIITLGVIFYYQRPKVIKKLKYTPRIRRLYLIDLTLLIILYTLLMLNISFSNLIQVSLIALICAPIHLFLAYYVVWPLEAIINLHFLNKAKKKLHKMNVKIVAITGSFGKTTTKNIVYEILKNKFMTAMSPASYNTLMGLSKTINNFVNKNDEILVLEMGASHPKDIEKLIDFVKPDYSILTEIGPQHLETFKSIDNIIQEKYKIVECITDGVAIINYDNEYIRNYSIKNNIKVVTIGIENRADFYAKNIIYSHKGLSFELIGQNTNIKIESLLLGKHNIYNILLAVALVKSVDEFSKKITDEEIAYSIKNIEPIPHRLSIRKDGNLTILDDSFNSNQKGFINALEVLQMSMKPRILITPGIVEMGVMAYEVNKSLASKIVNSCDWVYLVENSSSLAIRDGLLDLGFEKFIVVKSFHDAYNDSVTNFKEGTILIENDLTDNFIYRG